MAFPPVPQRRRWYTRNIIDSRSLRTSAKTEELGLINSRKRSQWSGQDDVTGSMRCQMHVVLEGNPERPAILTYHDIGLNHKTCFQQLFATTEMQKVMNKFCVYHLNAPGQHEAAATLPTGCAYPTMDDLALMIQEVVDAYSIPWFVGLGVGAGANILARYALHNPDQVHGLVLVNCDDTTAGWTERLYQKLNVRSLKSGYMAPSIKNYLLGYLLGEETMHSDAGLSAKYTDFLYSANPINLGYFIDSYIKRENLGLVRELDKDKRENVRNFRCPVLLAAGSLGARYNATEDMSFRLDPVIANWINPKCGGMILDEVPNEFFEAFLYLIQGIGFLTSIKLPSPAVLASA